MRKSVRQKNLSIGIQNHINLLSGLPVEITKLLMERPIGSIAPFFLNGKGQLQYKKEGFGKIAIKFHHQRFQLFKTDIGTNPPIVVNLELLQDSLPKRYGYARRGLKYIAFPTSFFIQIIPQKRSRSSIMIGFFFKLELVVGLEPTTC